LIYKKEEKLCQVSECEGRKEWGEIILKKKYGTWIPL
jgi:hypothetical protein